ncbi:uncharacterized protein LOC109841608 [Asparagus officinalis]|uniref:uncharacterized protein LOC109841608 n=1 Tax=Asparagus officinalis TaxID=4686 RepID=UPI00098E3C75|nr:uncharacterized protein LOC109841608 [Asparagus officinalis]
MEDPSSFSSPKFSKASSMNKRGTKSAQGSPCRLQTEQRGHLKEQGLARKVRGSVAKEAKHRIPTTKGLTLTTEQVSSTKGDVGYVKAMISCFDNFSKATGLLALVPVFTIMFHVLVKS